EKIVPPAEIDESPDPPLPGVLNNLSPILGGRRRRYWLLSFRLRVFHLKGASFHVHDRYPHAVSSPVNRKRPQSACHRKPLKQIRRADTNLPVGSLENSAISFETLRVLVSVACGDGRVVYLQAVSNESSEQSTSPFFLNSWGSEPGLVSDGGQSDWHENLAALGPPKVLQPGSEALIRLAHRYWANLVVLFGSRAQGMAWPTSDYALAVLCK